MKKLSIILFIAFASVKAFSQTTIAAADAAKHIGENVTISSKVFSARFLDQSSIVFLNVGAKFPDSPLTIVIKGDDLKKFKENPADTFKDKTITVTGTLVDYKGKAEIVVTDPAQIKVAEVKM
ncbi:hypothetical protein KXQ82_10035 [Mucilaginibacter sp. HMF5004]|uniref:hypothetical protein n=1 Tax=Mucilaginibacter rivuli TaxID=2857527 RepID=UPI001C5DAF63|nr:hypothetical protein [Mucilaginibacter rivuli]MBW4890057.1 hypothetical protein [Mucilaginibacter rivuli]